MPKATLYIVSHKEASGKWVGEFFTDRDAAADRFRSSRAAEELWEVPVEVDLDEGRLLCARSRSSR